MKALSCSMLVLTLIFSSLARASGCEDGLAPEGSLPNSYSALKGLRGLRVEEALNRPDIGPWLDMISRPRLVSNAVKIVAARNRFFFTQDRFVKCGMCAQMSRISVLSIILPLLTYRGEFTPPMHRAIDDFAGLTSGKAVFVFAKGRLIGAINAIGPERNALDTEGRIFDLVAPSFLALRDVTDANGRVSLAIGGVYEITRSFYEDEFLPALNAQGPYVSIAGAQFGYKSPNERKFLRDFNVGILNVDKITLYPRTFILNDKAWPSNQMQFASIFHERDNQALLWRNMLEAFRRVGETVEFEHRRDPQLTRIRQFLEENSVKPDEEDMPAFEYAPLPGE